MMIVESLAVDQGYGKKRNEMRKKLYEAQDEMDVRKEDLIARVEAQLKQRVKLENLFVIKWRVE